MSNQCTCACVVHAITPEDRAALERQIKIERRYGNTAAITVLQWRLAPCPTAAPQPSTLEIIEHKVTEEEVKAKKTYGDIAKQYGKSASKG